MNEASLTNPEIKMAIFELLESHSILTRAEYERDRKYNSSDPTYQSELKFMDVLKKYSPDLMAEFFENHPSSNFIGKNSSLACELKSYRKLLNKCLVFLKKAPVHQGSIDLMLELRSSIGDELPPPFNLNDALSKTPVPSCGYREILFDEVDYE